MMAVAMFPEGSSWLIIGATLLAFFVQPGIAMMESGFVRTKNATDMLMRVFTNFSISFLVVLLLGAGFLWGDDIGGFIGAPVFDFILSDNVRFSYLLFYIIVCSAITAIAYGAVAERTTFSTFCLGSVIAGALLYPVVGHWIWNSGGWLAEIGFHDFSGGAAIHIVGGTIAFVGCKMIGPRIGKYNLDGTANAIRGHDLGLSLQGVLFLLLGWMGITTGFYIMRQPLVSLGFVLITMNTAIAASILTTMVVTWIRYHKPDVSMMANSAIAGIAAIASGADVITPAEAVAVGVITGAVVVFAIEGIDKHTRLDDPTGAITVHGISGILGCLLTGVFEVGGNMALIMTQLSGIVAVVVYAGIISAVMFFAISKVTSLRVSQSEEINGLNFWEHGLAEVYSMDAPVLDPMANTDVPADAIPTLQGIKARGALRQGQAQAAEPVPAEEAVPVEHRPVKVSRTSPKMTEVAIITSELRFEALKDALEKVGITGMTVTKVLGFGLQKGHADVYRGTKMRSRLLPKVKVEMVVSAIPPQRIIDVAKKILYTGHYGDGKIFIYDVENVVKIRTGEEGYDALQDYPT